MVKTLAFLGRKTESTKKLPQRCIDEQTSIPALWPKKLDLPDWGSIVNVPSDSSSLSRSPSTGDSDRSDFESEVLSVGVCLVPLLSNRGCGRVECTA